MIFAKLFCKHKWSSHAKNIINQVTYAHNGYSWDATPIKKEFTREVLVCEHCGKIKIIEY